MNIYILSEDPIEAASCYCDQHVHKMILDSASMLSTATYHWFPALRSHIYKPSYTYDPVTEWVKSSIHNMAWLTMLAQELNMIRISMGYSSHRSSKVIDHIADVIIPTDHYHPKHFQDATPAIFHGVPGISLVQRYQLYYRSLHTQWLENGTKGMTYNNRPIPPFMGDLIIKPSLGAHLIPLTTLDPSHE